ncbi:hypothetical protein, partial [Enterococcus durans]|uniref:hypothetical protein n=1 Tax=Enterococcus durans TaxID=53345 RepID=UPI003DA4C093
DYISMKFTVNLHCLNAKFNSTNFLNVAMMSRLWTGFFGTVRCRTPKIFQNPDFSLKRRDFWVFL